MSMRRLPCWSLLRWAAVAIGATAGLAACANPAAERALFAQNALIGMSKSTLLSCAGVPERQAVVDNREYFTYRSSRLVSYPSAPVGFYGGGWGPRYGYGWDWPGYGGTEVASFDCDATFSLRNGVVERVVYGGASGGTARLGQCYAIVQNCLPQTPVASAQPTP